MEAYLRKFLESNHVAPQVSYDASVLASYMDRLEDPSARQAKRKRLSEKALRANLVSATRDWHRAQASAAFHAAVYRDLVEAIESRKQEQLPRSGDSVQTDAFSVNPGLQYI